MNDLEICKRIAEIDSVDFDYNDKRVMYWREENSPVETYNPLTDDALCFQLMVKYKVSVFYEYGYAAIVCDDSGEYIGQANLYEEPNKAICLAIIEAHK